MVDDLHRHTHSSVACCHIHMDRIIGDWALVAWVAFLNVAKHIKKIKA